MTIWILTLLLLASLAGLGYRQGAIRVAFSLAGILLGALLAAPLGGLIKPLFPRIGLANPLLVWWLPALIVFVLVLILFKVAGAVVHKKAEVYYKYNAGDLRLALWERVNRRTGLCLALCNGAAYLILISLVIHMLSYWTYQLATPASDSWKIKLVNRLGADLQSTGLVKAAASVDQTPDAYYEAADLAGVVFQTPLSEGRLSRYPALLDVSEQPKFQELAADAQFSELRQRGGSITEVLSYPNAQAILKDPALVESIEQAVIPNLRDLTNFMVTGISEKYSVDELPGRWNFDLNGTVALLRREKPNLSALQMAQTKRVMTVTYARTSLVATPVRQVYLKNLPHLTPGALAPELRTVRGEWREANGTYALTLTQDGRAVQLQAKLEGSRLLVTGEDPPLAFSRAH